MAFDLGKLLAEVSDSDTGREQIVYIDLDLLDEDDANFYATEEIESLAANIATVGLLDPLRIRPDPDAPGRYRVVSGHRRRKALGLLKQDDPERWGKAACIEEENSKSPALQELRLIFANKDNRKMSSADLSEQALRVENLLYQLQEEGYEFPGRMRDHVAKAVGVKTTKLARLKVIREKLDPCWVGAYSSGSLVESSAYALAQLPPQWQRVIYFGKSLPSRIEERTVKDYGDCFKNLCERTCPKDQSLCSNAKRMMEKSVQARYTWDTCKGCCFDCDELTRCPYSCLKAEETKKHLKAERKIESVKEKAEAKAQAEEAEAIISATYNRAREARDSKNIDAGELLKAAGISPSMKPFYADYETGKKLITKHTPLAYLNEVSVKAAKQLLAVSEKLDCSIDYLLGRDVPEVKAEPAEPAPCGWRAGDPDDPGMYIVLTSTGINRKLYADELHWNGDSWDYNAFVTEADIIRYWMPMPED